MVYLNSPPRSTALMTVASEARWSRARYACRQLISARNCLRETRHSAFSHALTMWASFETRARTPPSCSVHLIWIYKVTAHWRMRVCTYIYYHTLVEAETLAVGANNVKSFSQVHCNTHDSIALSFSPSNTNEKSVYRTSDIYHIT